MKLIHKYNLVTEKLLLRKV